MCAKLVHRWPKHTTSTDALKRLHWLPIQERIEYKILTITYKYIGVQAPQYLKDLIKINKPQHEIKEQNNYSGCTQNQA